MYRPFLRQCARIKSIVNNLDIMAYLRFEFLALKEQKFN